MRTMPRTAAHTASAIFRPSLLPVAAAAIGAEDSVAQRPSASCTATRT